MLELKNYLYNAYEIRAVNPDAAQDIGVACDMLRTNIVHGVDGNPGTDLDWPALRREWEAMTSEEQEASRAGLRELRKECVKLRIGAAFDTGDRAAFDAVVAQAEANIQAAREAAEAEAAEE